MGFHLLMGHPVYEQKTFINALSRNTLKTHPNMPPNVHSPGHKQPTFATAIDLQNLHTALWSVCIYTTHSRDVFSSLEQCARSIEP